MAQKKLSEPSTPLLLPLLVGLSIGLSWGFPSQVQAGPFKAPNIGTPTATAGGATRSGTCVAGKTSLIALVPLDEKQPSVGNRTNNDRHAGRIGLTTKERPTFFVYLPATNAQTAEFILKDVDEEDVYRTSIPLSGQQGVVAFQLPEDSPVLELNKDYQWYFNVICQPSDRLRDVFVTAWVRRVQPKESLLTALKNSNPRQHPIAYAQHGIWQDTLATLTELRQQRPSDATVTEEWNEFLKAVGLGKIPGGPPKGQLSLTTLKAK